MTLSTQDNAKLLQQLKSGFKGTVKRNNYQSKMSMQKPSPYLDYLIDPSFEGVIDFLFYHLRIVQIEH